MPKNRVEVEISGKTFSVSTIASANRNAVARLKGQTIVISLPSRWSGAEKERVWKSLYKRAIRAIEKGRWKPEQSSKVQFSDGQRVTALGREYEIALMPFARFRSRIHGRKIEVCYVEGRPDSIARASRMVRRQLEKALMGELRARVEELNRNHFGSNIGAVSLRDNSSRWGSCSPDGSISLNFRLIFMPREILDYVIVHELAHTKYRSHGPRFWALVERVIPDHQERRKWLRENGWKYPAASAGSAAGGPGARQDDRADPGQMVLAEFSDEPY